MKLNIYKNQKEIERTVEVAAYDIMFGTVEDILNIFDKLGDNATDDDMFNLISKNFPVFKNLIRDVFCEYDLKDDELKRIKLKELVPFFVDLLEHVKNSLGEENSKN